MGFTITYINKQHSMHLFAVQYLAMFMPKMAHFFFKCLTKNNENELKKCFFTLNNCCLTAANNCCLMMCIL